MIKHRRYKFSPRQLKNIQRRYESLGWKIMWLALYFRVHRRSILFHIRTKGWVRKVGIPDVMPEKVAAIYRHRSKIRYLDSAYKDTKIKKKKLVKGSYEYIRHIAEQQRLRSCQHIRWIKRCSICGMILESDSINHISSTLIPNDKKS